ncbi:MAG: flagellar assembly protein FliW [Oscillospiraceae bacterium]
MRIQTAHFGEVVIDDSRILYFKNGLPGLEDNKRFILLSNEESRPVSWLQSLESRAVSLPVIDPFKLCPDYSFDIPQEEITTLKIADVKDVFVLSILVIPRKASLMTVNLAAPIIINVRNNKGCQIILDDRKYRVRMPISDFLGKSVKDGV